MKNPISRKPPYELVKEAVFAKYIRNAPPAGTRLPADRELAQEFGVSIATIAKSVSALALEGHLDRKVGSGTYIRGATPGKVGIFLGTAGNPCTRPELVYYAKLDEHLQDALRATQPDFPHYSDMRIRALWGTPHPAVVADAKAGLLSDLIVLRANADDFPWLDALPANVIGYAVHYGRGVVDLDAAAFSRRAVAHLLAGGSRRIGLISEWPARRSPRTEGFFALHDAFHAALRQAGLPDRPEWVVSENPDHTEIDPGALQSERFGYQAFTRIWQAAEKPDGLVVHHDIVALGVLRAARDLGVDLRREVPTVFWANRQSPWPELAPYVRMAFSTDEIVPALLSMVGDPTPRTVLVEPALLLPE